MRQVLGNICICILLSLQLHCIRGATSANFTGDPACPCIDPWTDTDTNNESCRTLTWDIAEDDHDHFESTACVPMNYGASQCSAWDANGIDVGDPRCLASSDMQKQWGIFNFCQLNWCFVDVDNCDIKTNIDEVSEIATSQYDNISNLYRSYETCLGTIESSSQERDQILAPILNKSFRVGIPGDAVYDLYTNEDGTKNGSTWAMFELIREETNGTWEYVDVSALSMSKYSTSSYTACIHDVALGLVDFCVGNFWPTGERFLIHTPFSRSFMVDKFFLVSPMIIYDSVSYFQGLVLPFKVFTSEAWMGVVLTAFYFAVVMYVARITYAGGNYPGASKWEAFARGLSRISYDTLIYLTSADPSKVPNAAESQPKSEERGPEMVAIAGFAFFGLLTLTAYTASSAAAMVLQPYVGPMYQAHELAAITRNNHTICIPDPVRGTFLSLYGSIITDHDKVKGIPFGETVGEYYRSKDSNCTTMIVIEDMIEEEFSRGCLCKEHSQRSRRIQDVTAYPKSRQILTPRMTPTK
eukprot:CAMPEP_0196825104 /NCGR_PEP_ID=MMETSP1362-20130617/92860_1 /TAXON_ID=163516 /ORGANISM="Leptocylindrus danicus, Strain CCMP1856" /LENGTH=525 /DNA_ID=CAMNT_0042205481 /DNA_START=47 /DNA_END=1624 /DNA_ORIENTATION=-